MYRRDFENTLHAAALTALLLVYADFIAHSGGAEPRTALHILGWTAWLLIPLSLTLTTPSELAAANRKRPTRLGPWLYLALLAFSGTFVSLAAAPALLFFHGRHLAWSRPKLGSLFLGIWLGSAAVALFGLGWIGWTLTLGLLYRANRLDPVEPATEVLTATIPDKIQSWLLGITLTIVTLWLWPARDLFDGSTSTHDFSRWLTLLTLAFIAWHTLGAGLAEIKHRLTAGWLLLAALAWSLPTSLTTVARLGETPVFQSLVGWKPLTDTLNAGERLTETHWFYAPLLFAVIYALPVILGATATRVILSPTQKIDGKALNAARGMSEFCFAIGLTVLLICLSGTQPFGFPTTTGLPFFTNLPKQVARAENGAPLEHITFAGVTRTLEQTASSESFLVDGRNFLTFDEHSQERIDATLHQATQLAGPGKHVILSSQAWWQMRHNPLRELYLLDRASGLANTNSVLALACAPEQFPDFDLLQSTLGGLSNAWERELDSPASLSVILIPHGIGLPSLVLMAHSPEATIPLRAMADGTLLTNNSFQMDLLGPIAGPLPRSTAALAPTVFREIDALDSTRRAERVLQGFMTQESAEQTLLPFYLSLLNAQRYSVHDTFEHQEADSIELDAICLQELVKIARQFPHAKSVQETVHAMGELLVEKREVQWAHDTFTALQDGGLWQTPTAYWVRGVVALEMLDSEAATSFAEKALAIDPKYAPALELRSNATR